MALIAPVAFAAAGGLLSGGATWGMAAGWLIGSWLFNKNEDPKNQVFDPGAEEMPSFNQALRGATMPILFGTNRVSSNIIWTNNFTTIRNESQSSGGGGKGGGSGMGSKGGQPSSGEVTYEYKWDIMFHIGMTDQSVDLIGAWVGTEKVASNTITAIIGNSDSQWATFAGLTGTDGIDLNFEDSYYHGAGATGADIDPWSHFQSITGGPYRFPYTTYVGFKQLELGNTARIPQISWEIGEGGVTATSEGTSLVNELNPSAGFGYEAGPYASVIKCVDGTLVFMDYQTIVTLDGAQSTLSFTADSAADSLAGILKFRSDYVRTTSSFTNQTRIEFIEDRYVLLHCKQGSSGSTWRNEFTLWELTSFTDAGSGYILKNCVGCFVTSDTGATTTNYESMRFIGIDGEGTDDDYMWFEVNRKNGLGGSTLGVVFLPSINSFKNDNVIESQTSDLLDPRAYYFYERNSVALIESGFFSSGDLGGIGHSTYMYRDTRQFYVAMMPKVTVDIFGATWETEFVIYAPKADCQYYVDNPAANWISNQVGTYPDGLMVKFNGISVADFSNVTTAAATITIINNDVDNFPFDDAGVAEDGTLDDATDYAHCHTNMRLRSGLGAGGNLVIFWKQSMVTSDHARQASGMYTKIRAYIYNPLTQKYTAYINGLEGTLINTTADFAVTGPNMGTGTNNWRQENPSGYYDSTNRRLIGTWEKDEGGSGSSDSGMVGEFGTFNVSGGTDITPTQIIYRILTSTVYGLGIAESDIDTSTFQLADLYCESQSILVSCQYRREEGALAIITQLLELYGGFLIDSGGKIKFGIQEFSSAPVRTIDNDHLRVDQDGESPVLVTKGARQDTYNRVKVNYFDRNLSYRQNFIEVADEVDMDVNGVRAQEFPAKFVMSEGTARKMAVRALWGNMYARDIYDFKLGAKDADLEPGDVITLVDSFHTELQSGKQARIVTWQETEPLTFQVKAVEEVEYISTATLAADNVTEATSNSLFERPLEMAEFGMYELPAEFQGADSHVYVGYRQQSNVMGARLYLSTDGVTYGLVDEQMPYIVSGILADGLPLRGPGYVEEGVEVYLMPDQISSGPFDPSSPLYAQNHALDNVDASGRALGTGNIWINSEMMAYEGVNLLAQNHYKFDKLYRGWGGTHLQAHNSGDTWWRHGGGVFADVINVDKIGTLIYYKVTGFNFAGQEYDVSLVTARTYQIQGTFWRPQVQAPLATYVQSPGSFLTVQSEDLGYISKKQVIAGGSTVRFEWPQAAQEAGYGAQGYNTGLYGRFTQDTASVNYMIQVLSSDYSTVVRCLTVDTTAYEYTHLVNSEDWNGWTGNFAVRVTPFNTYGTALRSRTKILELFE